MAARAGLLVLGTLYVGWLVFAYEYHFIDGVNLLFHEAGHVFFGLFGRTLHFLGGTIGQLIFPAACAVHFLRRGQPFEACVVGIWGAESLMYAAEYIADARVQRLPLVGGHIHDWGWLLGQWGGLAHCEWIGTAVHVFASLLAVGLLGLAARILLSPEREAEPETPA